ncbi:AraC family transcriptional regulator [Lentilactobacillus kisonensis]|uniref:AraC family transcriptional regulator n=1 Tax=Lentilactobacillus kisonensis TaxID=481722 RepID=UPI000AAB8C7B|nr:AraC family transcriptional regulator [Lentilactobacillus kisonensis]
MPIISYISKHYAETISNEQLAKITKYSITYQNRVFKQVYNMTPLAYLNSYRMKKSESLATNPSHLGNSKNQQSGWFP